MITSIIFDLGGVLIDWNPKYLYRKIFDDEAEMDEFLENICTADWNEEQDAGRLLQEATDHLIQQHPEKEEHIRAFYNRWEEMLGGPIQGTIDIFAELRKQDRYKIYALTNWSAETFPIALDKYEFLHWFDGVVVSGTEKMRKPSPEFYQLLLSRYNINAAESLFIDDNVRNIHAASQVGLHVIPFSSPEALRAQLTERNLL